VLIRTKTKKRRQYIVDSSSNDEDCEEEDEEDEDYEDEDEDVVKDTFTVSLLELLGGNIGGIDDHSEEALIDDEKDICDSDDEKVFLKGNYDVSDVEKTTKLSRNRLPNKKITRIKK